MPLNRLYILTLIFIILVITGYIIAQKPKTKSIYTTLPFATKNGLNTFGCQVNTELVLPSTINGTKSIKAVKILEENGLDTMGYSISIANYDSIEGITIFIPNNIEIGGTYAFGALKHNAITLRAKIYNYPYSTPKASNFDSVENTGQLTINHIDTHKNILSGSFYFTAKNNLEEYIEVTNGIFDIILES